MKESIGVYVHIPFCTGLCSYCHYVKLPSESYLVNGYLDAVKTELGLHKEYLGDLTLSSLYFGGGTPTCLTVKQAGGLIQALREEVIILENAEITFESSPETLSKEKLHALKSIGVNRLSIGIQAFDDHLLLKVCARRHNEKMAIDAIRNAQKTNFERGVNIDLIYGLPDQTLESWINTLERVKELMPGYVTLYHLRIKKGTLISQTPRDRFPSDYNTLLMQISGIEFLTDLGYVQISPNQFALPGHAFEHQEHKWHNKPFIGLGVSAYGFINNAVYNNVRSIQDYGDAVHKGHLPVYLGKKLSEREQMTRSVIFGLKLSGVNRKDGGLSKKEFKEKYGIRVEKAFRETLKKLSELGLIEVGHSYVKLTYKGILFSDEVCREFYSREEKEILKRMGQAYGRGVF
jgi:oxygen-independent coproporphyrinogen-3 oxidase